MQVKVDGKRNITLDFEAPKKFKLLQDGKEIPYLRTGKNSFRLSRNIDGVLDLEEIIEQPKIVKPMQLQTQQMALVNPNDVLMINQAAQQLEVEQNILGETQKRVEQTQAYLDVQQQRINETVLSVQGLETNNAERITGTENGLFNLAGNLATTEQNLIDGIGIVNNGLQEHKNTENPHGITKKTIGLDRVDNTSDMDKPISKAVQNALDEKADKDEIQAIRDELGEYQEKNDRFTNALSNYTGGLAGNQLPNGGLTGQVLGKKSDISGDVDWIDSSASITVDDELSLTSENPVQNKVITSSIIIKSDTIPTATADLEGSVYQYTGENGTYTHGYIYECQEKTNYTPRILFEPSKIGYNYDYDLLAFFQEATPNFAQIKEGIFQYLIAGDIWSISAKDENGNIIFDNYKLYTEDLQDAGFVFLEPSYTDEEEVSYELALNPSVSYEWVRIDVQPNQSAEIASLTNRVVSIENKIPAQASSSNQLADKNFVNSSIATNTATFRGTYNSVAELEAYSGEKDNNDYAFVTGVDSLGNTYYDRYKYNGSSWVYEYRLNNSSFTASQWASINSGATTTNIGQIATNTSTISSHISNTSNPHEVTKAQVGLGNVDNTSDLNKPISTATQTALNGKQETLVSGTNIKTINNESILGSGNIDIQGGSTVDEAQLSWYGTCNTTPSAAAKVVVCPKFTTLKAGVSIRVKFTNYQGYNGTIYLNVNETGRKIIKTYGVTDAPRYSWLNGEIVSFTYDGTNWVMEDAGIATSSYYGYTKLTTSSTSSSTQLALAPAGLNNYAKYSISGVDAFSTSETYAVGDRVRYEDRTYECITAITTAGTWNASYWQALDPLQTQIDNIKSSKQDTLVSGTNIKTINNQSILGSGNINIQVEAFTAAEVQTIWDNN